MQKSRGLVQERTTTHRENYIVLGNDVSDKLFYRARCSKVTCVT